MAKSEETLVGKL